MTQLNSGIQMDLIQIAHDYGWAAVAVVVIADRLFPFAVQKLFPHFQQSQQAKLDAEKEEREFRHTMELRQAEAFDQLVKTCQGIENFMSLVNDRLGRIEANQHAQGKRVAPKKRTRNGQ